MKGIIKLYNRYGDKIYLKHIAGEFYTLHFENPDNFNHMTAVMSSDGTNVYSIDPPGGPYLCIGMEIIKGKIIKSLSIVPLLIELEEKKEEEGV